MNSSFENAEKGLKRWLKREAKITMATVVAFLITGAVSYGAPPNVKIKYFETQTGKEEIFDYGTREETVEQTENMNMVGFANRTPNTLGTIQGNGKLTVGKGGTGYIAANGGKIFFHAGTVVNVEKDGTGFLTNTVKGSTIISNTSTGKNTIDHGIELSAGTINVKGGTGFVAQQGGSIQIGNNGGTAEVGTNWVKLTVDNDGIGVDATGTDAQKAEIAFEKDSGLYVKNGTGVKAVNSNITFNNAVLKAENGKGIELNNSTVTNNSHKVTVSGENAVGFDVIGGIKNTINQNGTITANNGGTGIRTGVDGTRLVIASSGTVNVDGVNSKGISAANNGRIYMQNNVVVNIKNGGTGYYSETAYDESQGDLKEYGIEIGGGTITADGTGSIGFAVEKGGSISIGNGYHGNHLKNSTIVNVINGGTGAKVNDKNSRIDIMGDTQYNVKDGIGVELSGGTLYQNAEEIVATGGNLGFFVDGKNSIGITGTGTVRNIGTVNIKQGIGVLASESQLRYYNYLDNNNNKGTTKVSGNNSIGFKADKTGKIFYDSYDYDDNVLEISDKATGFYATEKGYVEIVSGKVNIKNKAIGFKADKTGKLDIGNGGEGIGDTTTLNISEKGSGISLSDSAIATLKKDLTLKVEDGIGVDLKGISVLTNNSTNSNRGIRVSNNSIGINVSGTGENNVKVNGVNGLIYVEDTGTGLKASNSGNVLNYESGTTQVNSENAYGVVADDGATIHFGNNKVGNVSADGTSFDTVLNINNGTGIKVGEKALVTIGKDVQITLTEKDKSIAEIDGGRIENSTGITIDNGFTGIKFTEKGGTFINQGTVTIESNGTGFTGNETKIGEIQNNGTIVLNDTNNNDDFVENITDAKSELGTGIKITSNGTIQIGDLQNTALNQGQKIAGNLSKDQYEKLLNRITNRKNDELLDIKGLIKDKDGDVIYVAGTNIGVDQNTGTGIPVGPDGKVDIGTIPDNEDVLKTDEESVKPGPTDPTGTGTVTITGDENDEFEDKVINVGGNLVITGPTGPSTGTGLVLDDVQINMYDKEGKKDGGSEPGIPGEELTFTGKVTVDNTDSGKTIDVGNDKLVIGTGIGTGGITTDITIEGGKVTGEDNSKIVIHEDGKLTLEDTDVEIDITGNEPDPHKTGTLVIGTGVTTQGITVGTTIVTGTGNETGKVKTEDLTITGGGELTSTGIDAGTVTFEDGTIDVSGDGGEIKTDEIIVEDNKYGEIFGGDINVGTGGIKVGVNAELTLDGDTNVGTDDDGDININVGTGGIFTNKGSFTGEGNLDIDNGSYNFETKGNDEDPAKSEKVKITGDIFVDNGSLSFKGDGIIDIGGDDNKGTISVGTDPDGNFADVSFAPESKLADNSSIKFVTGTNGSINIALGDNDQENSILGNPGKGTSLDFTDTAEGTVKFNTDKLTVAVKEIELNTDKVGDYPYIKGLDQNDLGDEKAQADADYIAEYIKGENGNPDKVVLSYNENLLYGYGEEIGEIGSAFRVIHDRVSEAVKKMVGPNATNAEKREAKAKLADSIYSANIYSETVRMSYDNLKMSEDAVLSLKHRTAKGELAGEGKALHSKTEYTREAKYFGNTSSDSEITGLLGAVEYGLSDNTRVGGVFSGSIQDLDAENGKADGNAFYVGAYINKHTSKYEVTAGAGYQFNKFETDNTYLGNTGTEKYDSHALSAYVHGRRIIDLGDGLSFQPKAKLSYSLIEQDDVKDNFMETKDAEIGIFEAEAGFDVVKSIYTDKAKVDVVFGTSLAKAMGDTDKEFEGSFFNETEKLGFKTAGAEIGENKIKFNVGAEVSYENGLFWNGEFNYSFGSKDTETYGVSVGAGYKF